MDLHSYRTLGRSGLVVSPLALGTMTFGAQRWGSGEETSRAVFDAYVEAGGDFLDTADVYSSGRSEEMLGGFIAERKLRDRLVVATKAGFARETGHPHAGGNGAKNIRVALEGSLARLRTDYVDLYWIHVWDTATPAEELLQTLTGLVRAGKVLNYGFSNTPSWYVAKVATLAAAHGLPAPVGAQYAYSLIERGIEAEVAPAARELGLGLVPWSPLGAGFLTGKYRREDVEGRDAQPPSLPTAASEGGETQSDGRLNGANPFGNSLFTDRNWTILDALREVAEEVERPPAQVALAWVTGRPGVASVLIGASKVSQLQDNVASLDVALSAEQRARLDDASATEPVYPSSLFSPAVNRLVFGGQTVEGWRC